LAPPGNLPHPPPTPQPPVEEDSLPQPQLAPEVPVKVEGSEFNSMDMWAADDAYDIGEEQKQMTLVILAE